MQSIFEIIVQGIIESFLEWVGAGAKWIYVRITTPAGKKTPSFKDVLRARAPHAMVGVLVVVVVVIIVICLKV